MLLTLILCAATMPTVTPPSAVARGAVVAQSGAVRPQPWRVLGPFRAQAAPSTRGDVGLEEAIEDAEANQPWAALTDAYPRQDGRELRWRALPDADGASAQEKLDVGLIDLGERMPELAIHDDWNHSTVLYLYRPLFATEATLVPVQFGSDDGLRLWLNGEELARNDERREFDPRAGVAELELEEGLNHLVVKLVRARGPWRFRLAAIPVVATKAAVDRAIDEGVEFLLARQLADGGWPDYPGYPLGIAGIGTYTLLKCGLPPDHPAVARGIHRVREGVGRGTYSVALQMMALSAARLEEDLPFLEELTELMVDWQLANGMWAYPSGAGDLSNTQYAALGLRAAAERGIEVPQSTWKDLAEAVLQCGGEGGSFGYSLGSEGGSASMTAAGVATLAICLEHLDGSGNATLRRKMTQRIEAGVEQLRRQCPLHGKLTPGGWKYYAVYGYERAGGLVGTESFGRHDWYPEGALGLLRAQEPNGAWLGQHPDLNTSYALLFLRRATVSGAVTRAGGDEGEDGRFLRSQPGAGALVLRASLQPPMSMWIEATSPAFDDLTRVVYWLAPPDGTWQRIDEVEGLRYAARLKIDGPGLWQLRASGFLKDGTSVASGILEIERKSPGGGDDFDLPAPVISNRELEKQRRRGRNDWPAEASSTAHATSPQSLSDLLLTTGWRCAASDAEPWIEVRLRTPREIRRLRLAPAPLPPRTSLPRPLPAQVRVVFANDEERVVQVPEEGAGVLDLVFDPPVRSATVRIEILEIHGAAGAPASVGFGELLLD